MQETKARQTSVALTRFREVCFRRAPGAGEREAVRRNNRMHEVKVSITRFVDPHQPGFVECELVDADGIRHVFTEKVPVVSDENLWIDSNYPCSGKIRCTVLERFAGPEGVPLVRIDTELPDHLESAAGKTVFVIGAHQVASVPDI